MAWAKYRRKRGSFNLGIRIEHGVGLLCALYANSKSKNSPYKRWDFIDHDEEPPIQLEDAMEQWK